jgi:hypothetical protein
VNDYILLHHDDAKSIDAAGWPPYFAKLRASGAFSGGSSIGVGQCFRKSGEIQPITAKLVGYIRVQAESLEAACAFLAGNPVYDAGGTVEIRELPRD